MIKRAAGYSVAYFFENKVYGGSTKNYIGVKIVKAEPENRDGNPGYKVKYPDGYISWCPKSEFEKAYRALDSEDMNLITIND